MINHQHRHIVCTEDSPIAVTDKGRVRGFIADGIAAFRGIRYARAARFEPPVEMEAWEGVLDCMNYGYNCPNPAEHMGDNAVWDPGQVRYDAFTLARRYYPENENCQYLNVWTPWESLGEKKPVMVWIHGGGYTGGSATELDAYDGEELSRVGNVVAVSVTHRLNMFGYMNMADYGEKYAHSVNAGMLDLVAALKWVQKNISSFGGDPDNVTIMGQSGGGGKVITLMQMPIADGLYHKAIIQSGVMEPSGHFAAHTQESTRRDAGDIMDRLGITKENIERVNEIPALQLVYAANAVSMEKTGRPFSMGWCPIEDELYVGNPLAVGFRKETARVPLIVGSNLSEFIPSPRGGKARMPREAKEALIAKRFGDKAREAEAAFGRAWPDLDVSYAASMDGSVRSAVVRFCRERSRMAEAPVYNYVFAYESPFYGGWMPGHSGEIAFALHNAADGETLWDGDISARIQDEMAGSWARFAWTGSPNGPLLPRWDAFTWADRACMVYENRGSGTRVGDFDREIREMAKATDQRLKK